MGFYRRCVQRHLYVHGEDRHFLAKSPTLTPKLRALREFFPDAKIVYCARSPFQVVPSTMSLLSIPWDAFANEDGARFRKIQVDFLAHWYRQAGTSLALWPERQRAVLPFERTTTQLKDTVVRLYAQFGIPMHKDFARRLEQEAEKARAYKSGHEYSLERFSLTREAIERDFRQALDDFGFES